MPPQSQSARELARRLLAREAPDDAGPDDLAAAERVCQRVSENLSRWVGADGCHALFARALALAQLEHPVLKGVRRAAQPPTCLEGLAESAHTHDARTAAEGVVAILTALIELLGRLIGDDMAMSLVEQSVPVRATGAEAAP